MCKHLLFAFICALMLSHVFIISYYFSQFALKFSEGESMKLLENRILNDGNVLGEDILKVDSFLTHQVDYELMQEIGKVFADAYKDAGITKVVTIEASGIAPALYAAQAMKRSDDFC